ncbi:hypothetical protein AO825_07495 [Pectobacterium brasiliense]|nr:hypothetical protein AO825_07495 [Pectobacterium brasiliense]
MRILIRGIFPVVYVVYPIDFGVQEGRQRGPKDSGYSSPLVGIIRIVTSDFLISGKVMAVFRHPFSHLQL